MPRYLIERKVPGAGKMKPRELTETAEKSVGVLKELGPDVQWVQSYVLDDKIVCVYNARDAEICREHARRAGFPADTVSEVKAILDPITAEDRGAR